MFFFFTRNTHIIITEAKLHRGPQKETILQYSPRFGEEKSSDVHGVGGDEAVGGGSQGRQRRIHPGGLTAQSIGWRQADRTVETRAHRWPKDSFEVVTRGWRTCLNRDPKGRQHRRTNTRRGATLLPKSTLGSEAAVERKKCAARWSRRAQTTRPGQGGAEQWQHGSDPLKMGLDP